MKNIRSRRDYSDDFPALSSDFQLSIAQSSPDPKKLHSDFFSYSMKDGCGYKNPRQLFLVG